MNLPQVRGVGLRAQTRSAQYHGPTDIIAIKMKCCGEYWACKDCHVELAGHAIVLWPDGEWDQLAILCGGCGLELTIRQDMECVSRWPRGTEGRKPRGWKPLRCYFW